MFYIFKVDKEKTTYRTSEAPLHNGNWLCQGQVVMGMIIAFLFIFVDIL